MIIRDEQHPSPQIKNDSWKGIRLRFSLGAERLHLVEKDFAGEPSWDFRVCKPLQEYHVAEVDNTSLVLHLIR